MSEILDNQELTTEMLNNIATDLGFPEFNGFGEAKFGVEKLNNITGDLVGKGILDALDKCRMTYNNEFSETSGLLTIGTGIIVFGKGDEDTYRGAKLRITSPLNVEIAKTENTVYVYAVNDTVNNKIELRAIEEELNNEEDFLLLCKIENGILLDKRIYAKSKVDKLGVCRVYKTKCESKYIYSSDRYEEKSFLLYSIPLPPFNIRKILFYFTPSTEARRYKYTMPLFIYDVNDNTWLVVCYGGERDIKICEYSTDENSYHIEIDESIKGRIVIEGDNLNIYVQPGLWSGTFREYTVEFIG